MEYVARAPAPSLESIVDDLCYLAGTPPYPRLTIPPMPSALVIGRERRLRGWVRVGNADLSEDRRVPPELTVGRPTGYLDLRRRFAAEHPGSALDVGPLPPV
jgi:hypothetical protein